MITQHDAVSPSPPKPGADRAGRASAAEQKNVDPHAFMARYRSTYSEIAGADAPILANKHNFSRPDFLLPIALFGGLAGFAKILAFLPLESIAYDDAIGFSFLFLMISAILNALVFFGGLSYGAIRWEGHFPSSHVPRLIFLLIALCVLVVILIVRIAFGLY